MAENGLLTTIEQQDWLQPGMDRASELIKDAFQAGGEQGQNVKNALHGVWLGHPLHSAITDVPVGSWTAAVALDVLEMRSGDQYAAGADAAVAVGLLAAVPAALSGLTDWSDTHGKPQRVGALHGLLNVSAASLYAASYVARKAEKRGLGRWLSFAGFGFVLASAYLGGELSYHQRIGVNHAADRDEDLPQDYAVACNESELAEGQPSKVTVNGTEIFLLKRGAMIYALGNKCAHLGGPLSEGKVEGDVVQCAWHGSRFCLKDGSVVDRPATIPQPVLEVKVQDGQVLVRAGGERS